MIANDNQGPDAKGLFCSSCGSADVKASNLAGGEASCNVCGWAGRVEELAAFHFTHGMGNPEEVFRQFFLDIRKLLSQQFAKDVAALLMKWGFLEVPDQHNKAVVAKHLARYVAGIAKAVAEGVVKVRGDIEKETHRDQPSA